MKALLLLIICITLVQGSQHVNVPVSRYCDRNHPGSGVSDGFYENIAHAVHGMTVQGLKMFNPRATIKNVVPTVNLNASAPVKVLPYAPDVPLGKDFVTSTMNGIDKILSNIGVFDDGLGKYWSPVGRIIHNFHMLDLWQRIRIQYEGEVAWNPPKDGVCDCLLDMKNNGVYNAVEWVANHYIDLLFTLLDRPIPQLTDAKAWSVWKDRLLQYYTGPAINDAALYMYCATKDF